MRMVCGFIVSVKLWAAINHYNGLVSCIHITFFNFTCCMGGCFVNLMQPCLASDTDEISVDSKQFNRNLLINAHTDMADILREFGYCRI